MLTLLRCISVVFSNALFAIGRWVILPFPKLLPRYFALRERLVRILDPQGSCWYTCYLNRWYKFYTRYPKLTQLPEEPCSYIETLVEDVGVCFEAIVRCSDLASEYARAEKWREAEEMLRRCYGLAAQWLRTPVKERHRSPYDFLIPKIATAILVGLWLIEKARQEGKELRIDPAYQRGVWVFGLASNMGIDTSTLNFLHAQAHRHVRELKNG